MKPNRILALVAASLLVAGAAAAQGKPPTAKEAADKAAHARHALFETMGVAMGPVGGMLRGGAFDAAAAGRAGLRLEVLGGMIKEVTALDTSKLVTKSEAKPNIWTDRADFDAKADAMVAAAVALKTAAATGDKAATTAAMQKVGGSCKACHDKYRAEKK
jgi:cytochrome c556